MRSSAMRRRFVAELYVEIQSNLIVVDTARAWKKVGGFYWLKWHYHNASGEHQVNITYIWIAACKGSR